MPNSSSHRQMHMRFLRKMTGKKVQALRPGLAARFKNPGERPKLFADFFEAHEDLDQVELIHQRRHRKQQQFAKQFVK
eukprot:435519-Alexandrium_andersonii.AAC.1